MSTTLEGMRGTGTVVVWALVILFGFGAVLSRASETAMRVDSAVDAPTETGADVARDFGANLMKIVEFSRAGKGYQDPEIQGLVEQINRRIDLELLAARALGKEWRKIAPKERDEFKKLLREMLEYVVYPRARDIRFQVKNTQYYSMPDNPKRVRVVIPVERVKGDDVTSEDFELVLEFENVGNRLFIADCEIEKELISANIHRQYQRAREKKSFLEILRSMKDSVQKAKQGLSSQVAARKKNTSSDAGSPREGQVQETQTPAPGSTTPSQVPN